MKTIKVGNNFIGDNFPTFIIAEIGINHGGSENYCLKLVNEAIKSKVNAIKLQTINAGESYVKNTKSFNEFKNKNLDIKFIKKLITFCKKKNIILFSTPGDLSSLKLLESINMEMYKISSGLANNVPLIESVAKLRKPVIISTGMLYKKEIKEIINIFKKFKNDKIALLKCTSLYPSPDDKVNLNAISTFKKTFPYPIGYSDHTLDDTAALSAVSIGANIIEKHITLDKKQKNADHFLSLEPIELKNMIVKIRRIEKLKGISKIIPTNDEIKLRSQRHRCIVASCNIRKNSKLDKDNISFKRPLKNKIGIPTKYFRKVTGKRVKKNLKTDDPINWDILF